MSTPLRERPDAPLGTLIFRAGLLPAETIESALQESSRTGKRLGEILLERNLLEETQLSRLLAGQKGLPFVTLRERGVDREATELFTEDQARLYRALPFELDSGSPTVAISDPTNEVVMRNIREALDGTEVQFAVATRSELAELMSEIYNPNGNHSNGHGAIGNGASPAPEPPAAEEAAVATVDPEPVAAPVPDVTVEPLPEPESETVADPLPLPEPAAAVVAEPESAAVEAALPEPEPLEEPHVPEPAAATPEVPALTLAEPAPAEVAPEPAPASLRLAPPQPVSPPAEPDAAAGAATVRVVIRLSNNDRVEAAVLGDPYSAKAQAKALIRYIAGKDGNDWPYIGGRFLRPDAIVSVDLVDQTDDGGA